MAEAGQRKKDRWGLFLLIWALVLLLLGVGCCCFLYRYLDVYEKTRPEPVVDAYLAQNSAKQLLKTAQSNVQLDVTEFEDPSDLYAAYLSTVDTDRPLTYRPRTKDSSEHVARRDFAGLRPSQLDRFRGPLGTDHRYSAFSSGCGGCACG